MLGLMIALQRFGSTEDRKEEKSYCEKKRRNTVTGFFQLDPEINLKYFQTILK